MAKSSPALTSFNTGELGPTLEGRVDLQKYPNGCYLLENFIPLPQGPAQRRGGTAFVAEVKNSGERVWLRRFEFSATQAYLLEFGNKYIRFYALHGQVIDNGSPYEVATPYDLADLTTEEGTFALQIEQSADVLYIAGAGKYPPMTLTRLGPTNWVLAEYRPANGPWQDENTDEHIVMWADGQTGTVTIKSNADVFAPSDVGRLIRLRVQSNVIAPWEADTQNNINVGDLRRNDGKTYKALNSAKTGLTPPTHDSGVERDGEDSGIGVFWEFQDAGYGVARITTVTSAKEVTAEVLTRLPRDVVGKAAAITSITNADPAVVTANGHGFTDNRVVYLYGVEGMTEVNHQFFWIGGVTTNTFNLVGHDSTGHGVYTSGGTAVMSATSRWSLGAWSKTSGYPSSVSFAYDRLWWANGIDYWASVPGKYDDMAPDTAGVIAADSAITGKLTAQDVNEILWMAEAERLLIGTPGGEFALGPITSVDPLGPENVQVVRQSKRRVRQIPPETVGTSLVYVQRSGRRLLLLDYDFTRERYSSVNMNALNMHVTKSGIVDMAYQAEPDSLLWCVLADGSLICFTLDMEQDVTGWHRHPIGGNGFVEAVECIPDPDGDRDEVWIVVRRTINGQTKRYIEYLRRPWERGDDPADVFYIDSGLTYSGAPATTISGLDHLEGETVQVVVDGAAHPDKVVNGGQITLERAGSRVQVGLACPARLVTMRLEAGAPDGTSQGKVKRINSIVLRLLDTLGGFVGLYGRALRELKFRRPSMPMDAPPEIFTGDIEATFDGDYETDNRIEIKQTQPFPMTVVGIYPNVRTYEQRK